MLVQQPVESRARHAQYFGGDTQVIAVTTQYIAQRLAFGPGLVFFEGAHRRGDCMLTDQPQITGLDLPAFGQHQPATNAVGQFANIAWPCLLYTSDAADE